MIAASLTRRRLLRIAGAAGVAPLCPPGSAAASIDASIDASHRPEVRVPPSAIGSLVPIFVSVPLAMTDDHYIESLSVAVPSDPIPSKGRVRLTPASGEAYLYTQARVDDGKVELVAAAECARHGRFEKRVAIEVLEGG